MPNGKVHYELWRLPANRNLAVIVSILSSIFTKDVFIGISFYLGYLVIGNYLDPDLDLKGRSYSERRMIWDFGLLGYFFRLYWSGYAYLCKWVGGGHRGWMSHSPLLSSIIRFVYGFWWLGFLLPVESWPYLTAMCLGLAYSDLIHILADFTT